MAVSPTKKFHAALFINKNQGERTMFYAKFIVRKHERALLFRDGDFVKFLEIARGK